MRLNASQTMCKQWKPSQRKSWWHAWKWTRKIWLTNRGIDIEREKQDFQGEKSADSPMEMFAWLDLGWNMNVEIPTNTKIKGVTKYFLYISSFNIFWHEHGAAYRITSPSRTYSAKSGGPADQLRTHQHPRLLFEGGFVCRNCHIKMDDLFATLIYCATVTGRVSFQTGRGKAKGQDIEYAQCMSEWAPERGIGEREPGKLAKWERDQWTRCGGHRKLGVWQVAAGLI